MSDFEFETKPKRNTKAKQEVPVQMEPKETPVAEKPEEEPVARTREERALFGDTHQYKMEDFEEAELIAIFDAILFEGEYSEDVVIGGRLNVRFRTRTMGQVNEMVQALDKLDAKLITTISEARSQINLRQALVGYQGVDVDALSKEEKDAFFSKIPGPVTARLIDALRKFDIKVAFACAFGDENL